MWRETAILMLCWLLIPSARVCAQVAPGRTTYQGLIELEGRPFSGELQLGFTVWDAPEAGTPVGDQFLTGPIQVEDGLVSTELDLSVSAEQPRWLEITVYRHSEAPVVLFPRTPILASPRALSTPASELQTDGTAVLRRSREDQGRVPLATVDAEGCATFQGLVIEGEDPKLVLPPGSIGSASLADGPGVAGTLSGIPQTPIGSAVKVISRTPVQVPGPGYLICHLDASVFVQLICPDDAGTVFVDLVVDELSPLVGPGISNFRPGSQATGAVGAAAVFEVNGPGELEVLGRARLGKSGPCNSIARTITWQVTVQYVPASYGEVTGAILVDLSGN